MPRTKITKTKTTIRRESAVHHWEYIQNKPHEPTIKFLSSKHRLCSTAPCECGKVK